MRTSVLSSAPETRGSVSGGGESVSAEIGSHTGENGHVAPPASLDPSSTVARQRNMSEIDRVALGERAPKLSVQSLPIRQYLDLMVVPALLPALTVLVNERPEQPVEFLAHWLLENGPKYAARESVSASPADSAALSALLGRGI
ncbi:putative Dpy-30 motif domain-containing protein [Neospora caninum Liverpool]|uniref:Dpy-30 motif domain-containing protein, putative n=1 Tax=Neospora caninum (strain Liverpool) TaxID=572307 RepID=F0VEN1_NEOCL|nr:putative Dpy-30 motif domain-containing protein [Neospora caninum Liverpool]CBZ52175.1 putative Dpy-30 motif domain-containing protein [Neospora caninum Liverpool]CEL66141.1 TPA: Dpy-30 motif domain-containing protein, putative [Neospora caninum Liverpool]|eukprot:XP_003882207.1 putative Dpy-30 motif domain-containing protein [Neospora caninum Liverpool]